MEYNILGKTGFSVSRVSFGCMSLQSKAADNDLLIRQAIDSGINLFDTADLYEHGENERLLGAALKGMRQQVHISTKVGNRWKPDGSGWDWCPQKDHILEAVNKSLERLQTDYIDLYLLHGGTLEDPFDEVMEAFERLKTSGKIRQYGISSIRPNVLRHCVANYDIAAVMTQYSYLDRRPEEETLPLLQKGNIGVMARGTIAGGLLIDKPAKPYLGMQEEEVKAVADDFKANIPDETTAVEAAIGYVLAHPAVSTAVAGIRTNGQLREAVGSGCSGSLTKAQREKMATLHMPMLYTDYR